MAPKKNRFMLWFLICLTAHMIGFWALVMLNPWPATDFGLRFSLTTLYVAPELHGQGD